VLSRDRLFRNEDKISGYFELGVETNAVLGVQNPSPMYGSFMWRPKRQRYQRIHVSMLTNECLAQDKNRWRARMNAVMNLWVAVKWGNFLSS
jgi:hypothetical protein